MVSDQTSVRRVVIVFYSVILCCGSCSPEDGAPSACSTGVIRLASIPDGYDCRKYISGNEPRLELKGPAKTSLVISTASVNNGNGVGLAWLRATAPGSIATVELSNGQWTIAHSEDSIVASHSNPTLEVFVIGQFGGDLNALYRLLECIQMVLD